MVEIAYNRQVPEGGGGRFILGSKPYLFLVGPQKREFFVHASLAAGQSAVLDTLVNGSMQEATDGCTVWEGVDEDTFVRFGQYVYTGNYESSAPFEPPAVEEPAPELAAEEPVQELVAEEPVQELVAEEPAPELEAEQPAPEPDSSGPAEEVSAPDRPAEEPEVAKEDVPAEAPCEPEPKPEPADAGFWSAPPRSIEKKKKKKSRLLLEQDISVEFPSEADEFNTVAPPLTQDDAWKSFQEKQYDAGDSALYSVPPNASNRRIVYEHVFLEHARVHMMAYYYDIQPLAQLALFNLHRALCTFTLHDERMGDVVGLLRYSYREDERPLLRALVSEYAACHVKQLWADAEFRELFAEHGEMSVAIMGCIMERLQ